MAYRYARLGLLALSLSIINAAEAQRPSNSIGQGLSTVKVLPGCQRKPGTTDFDQRLCLGQVMELYELSYTGGLSNDVKFCPPDGQSVMDFAQVINDYVARSGYYALPFFLNAQAALKEKWPCEKPETARGAR